MSNRRVSFDIETRDADGRPVMMVNGKVWGYVNSFSFEPMHMEEIDLSRMRFDAIDFGLDDMIRTMKTELRPLPREPHRTYDWRQRLPSRRRH